MQRSNSWLSSLAAAVGRAIGVVESGPLLPTWSPQSSPDSGSPYAFCRTEEMLRALPAAGAGHITATGAGPDPGARWVNIVETGTAPPSVFVPVGRITSVQ